jgi:hypothetical protein
MVVQQKTRRPVQLEITTEVKGSLLAWLECRGGTIDDYAFPSRLDMPIISALVSMPGWLMSG